MVARNHVAQAEVPEADLEPAAAVLLRVHPGCSGCRARAAGSALRVCSDAGPRYGSMGGNGGLLIHTR